MSIENCWSEELSVSMFAGWTLTEGVTDCVTLIRGSLSEQRRIYIFQMKTIYCVEGDDTLYKSAICFASLFSSMINTSRYLYDLIFMVVKDEKLYFDRLCWSTEFKLSQSLFCHY